ncbi:MAG: preprotein translocase subunit YajC [Dehalococcoidia bacterium]|nr:preprotein translocase subunit YajC [Dehalococcoidia bacterium]
MEQLQGIAPILFLVLIFAAMYFFMIKPQRKRQKEQQELVQELRRGDKVVTTGGIYGQIENLSQDTVVLRIESGATIKVARISIAGKQGKQVR